jgi:uncharacterized membrane protein YebE (DUF533 family)
VAVAGSLGALLGGQGGQSGGLGALLEGLGDEVSESERQFVVSEMQSSLVLPEFLRSVPKGAEQQVYLMSLLGIDLDTQAEAQYLGKLRDGLGISQQASNAIHEQLGVQALYS